MARYVPALIGAVLYDILQGRQDATGAVGWDVLHEEQVLGHSRVIGERYVSGCEKPHNPKQGGGISFDLYKLIDILVHGSKNLREKHLKITVGLIPKWQTSGQTGA